MALWKWYSLLWGLLILGCQEARESLPPYGPAPNPPVAVNGQLPDYRPLYQKNDAPTSDTVIVGRCVASDEYAKTNRGDWNDHWFLVRVQVMTVEKGTWSTRQFKNEESQPQDSMAYDDLLFIAWDEWPTPESGINIDKWPWPYRINCVYAFMLDTSTTPATLVGQESRRVTESVMADSLSPMKRDDDPKKISREYSRIITATKIYLSTKGLDMKRHVLEPVDVTTDAYLVISRIDPILPILAVSKKDFTVRPIPWTPISAGCSDE